ncbi:MAG: BrnA antitoxin family protein [Bryobacterales bacterium]|nr:BrnA antitoxin family protein [Bryobacterales bacterium]
MAKSGSGSSRPGKQTRVSADAILSKPLTKKQKAVLEQVAERQRRADHAQIDYSDIPPLSAAQLAQMRRPRKTLVAVRLDADVLDWVRRFGPGYSTRINQVLRAVMEQQR